jgi:DNA-binding transcriptional LysR family regulator
MLDPQDFRDILLIARERSLKGAAQRLGVDPSTMGRRLESVEARFGARLFLRSRRGLSPSPDAHSALAAAEKLEEIQLGFERELLSRHPERANGVTVTAAEWSVPLLTPVLGAIAARHPEVTLRLRVENRVLDLSRREADVALRVGRPEEAALSGRRIGVARYGLFGSAAYLRRHRAPRNRAEASTHAFCALDEQFSQTPHMRWQAALAGEARVVLRTNSMLALVEVTRAGHGLATLPCVLGARHEELVPVLPELEVVERDLWLVYHRDLRSSRRLRPILGELVDHVRALFAG